MAFPKLDNNDQLKICLDCIKDEYLRSEAKEPGLKCDFCGATTSCTYIWTLAISIRALLRIYYLDTRKFIGREAPDGDRIKIMDLIAEKAGVGELPAQCILKTLEKFIDTELANKSEGYIEFSPDALYIEKPDWYWRGTSGFFEDKVKWEARYFNSSAKTDLDFVFNDIDKHVDKNGESLVMMIGPSNPLSDKVYRARSFQSLKKQSEALQNPHSDLGPPPSQKAKPGRMNALGISVFYGATSPKVAVAEIRPPVASLIVISSFQVTRDLRLLDVRRVQELDTNARSRFDSMHLPSLFLPEFAERISRVVLPNDEPFEYIATQAIADYLANAASPRFDGIIYPSSQTQGSGANIVLFRHACRLEVPSGAKTHDDPEDSREPALRLDLDKLALCEVKEVDYSLDPTNALEAHA